MSEPSAARDAPRLSVRGLTVDYGALRVLDSLDLELAPGEHVALLGRSGSGKTTLLRAVAGLLHPTAGRVSFGGELWSDGPRQLVPPERRRIGMLAQHPALWPHMSVEQHLRQVLRWRRVPASLHRAAIDDMLAALGLADLRRRRPAELSGGQAQRAALARALIGGSRLLLLDEPLTYLDLGTRRELAALIAERARAAGAAVLHITHDPRDAAPHADRLALLTSARISHVGAPASMSAIIEREIEQP